MVLGGDLPGPSSLVGTSTEKEVSPIWINGELHLVWLFCSEHGVVPSDVLR